MAGVRTDGRTDGRTSGDYCCQHATRRAHHTNTHMYTETESERERERQTHKHNHSVSPTIACVERLAATVAFSNKSFMQHTHYIENLYFTVPVALWQGALPLPLNFGLSKNCRKFFCRKIVVQNAKFELKTRFGGELRDTMSKFWASIISSVGKLKLPAPPTFFNRRRRR